MSAINNQNLIVGTTGSNSSAGEYSFAFLYDGSSVTNLGTLPVNETEFGLTSYANDINDSNQVVGSSWLVTTLTSLNDPTKYHAFIWEDGQMTDLNDQVQQNTGWILTRATAIGENGDIVGIGLKNGIEHGFLLTTNQLPPPSTNLPPVAIIDTLGATSGKKPLTVNFIGSASYDPEDGSNISHEWDFGDGSEISFIADPSHIYTVPGMYTASLKVTDSQGMTNSAQVEIVVRKNKRKK